jgi:hypothetical protein
MARTLLKLAGACTLLLAVFQAAVSFSPSWSLYSGAAKELADRPELLLAAGVGVAGLLVGYGLTALSGAGVVRSLPREMAAGSAEDPLSLR